MGLLVAAFHLLEQAGLFLVRRDVVSYRVCFVLRLLDFRLETEVVCAEFLNFPLEALVFFLKLLLLLLLLLDFCLLGIEHFLSALDTLVKLVLLIGQLLVLRCELFYLFLAVLLLL